MANLYEGNPDARQQGDIKVTRFRPRYRALSEEELALHDMLKTRYDAVEQAIQLLPEGRYRALAITALEESCMWAVKQLTA